MPGRSSAMSRMPRRWAATRPTGAIWRDPPGVPWNHRMGRPSAVPYSQNPIRRASGSRYEPSRRGAGSGDTAVFSQNARPLELATGIAARLSLTSGGAGGRLRGTGNGGAYVLDTERQLLRDLLLRADVPVQSLVRPRCDVRLLPSDTRVQYSRRKRGGCRHRGPQGS